MRTDPPATVVESFRRRVTATPRLLGWQFRTPQGWEDLTWRDAGQRVRAVSSGLIALGVKPGDRVAILSGTRVEWMIAALGVLSAGAAVTTIYPSNTPEECAFVLSDSGSRALIVESTRQLTRLAPVLPGLPALSQIVLIDGEAPNAVSWHDLQRRGKEAYATEPEAHDAVGDAVKASDLAALIYTSGTTGQPKGVMLTHDNFTAACVAVEQHLPLEPIDKQFMFLPLSHSFGLVTTLVAMHLGAPTAFDGDIDRLVQGLAEVRPTFLPAVPRVFEKVYAKVADKARAGGERRFAVFQWAEGVGREWSKRTRAGQRVGRRLTLKYAVANRLVFSKVRAAFGGRIRAFASGGAPLAVELAEFFHACGIPVMEGYGLTESTAISTVNRLEDFVLGTVGRAGDGLDVKIADDGEVLIRGRTITPGYWNLPDATAEVLDAQGWLHTGDIGELDGRGFLKITDRKKNLIVTSGGKNIAPAKIENRIKARVPWIAEVLVHGDKRNYLTALIALDPEGLASLAKHEGWTGTPDALLDDPRVRAHVQSVVQEVNASLPKFETIKAFALWKPAPSIESGELTQSMKVRRKVAEARHRADLDALYPA